MEVFPLGVRRYTIDDGEIAVVVSTGDMAPKAIDEWAQVMIDTIQRRVATGLPVYMITESSAGEHGFSRYARARVEDIQNSVPSDYPIYAAMLFPKGIVSQFVGTFVNTVMRMRATKVQNRMFSSRDEALRWLYDVQSRHT